MTTTPTTLDAARRLVIDALRDIAPDLDPDAIDPDARLQEDLGLDSMYRFYLIVEIAEGTGLDIPEADYPRLGTLAGCADYLVSPA